MTLPSPGTPLQIEAADGALFAGLVVSQTASGLLVDWPSEKPEPSEVTVRWGTPRGLMVASCRLSVDGRYGQLEPLGEPRKVQRREAVRVELTLPVRWQAPDGRTVRGSTINVSGTGLLVSGSLSREVGEVVQLGIELPDRPDPLEVSGRVRRAVEPETFGVELTGLTQGQQDRLMHLVFEQQRDALRRRRRGGHLRLVEDG